MPVHFAHRLHGRHLQAGYAALLSGQHHILLSYNIYNIYNICSTWFNLKDADVMLRQWVICRLAVDMCIGSVIVTIWSYVNLPGAMLYAVPLATGFISGEGIWSVPQAILTYAKATGPICMMFVKAGDAATVTAALGS